MSLVEELPQLAELAKGHFTQMHSETKPEPPFSVFIEHKYEESPRRTSSKAPEHARGDKSSLMRRRRFHTSRPRDTRSDSFCKEALCRMRALSTRSSRHTS